MCDANSEVAKKARENAWYIRMVKELGVPDVAQSPSVSPSATGALAQGTISITIYLADNIVLLYNTISFEQGVEIITPNAESDEYMILPSFYHIHRLFAWDKLKRKAKKAPKQTPLDSMRITIFTQMLVQHNLMITVYAHELKAARKKKQEVKDTIACYFILDTMRLWLDTQYILSMLNEDDHGDYAFVSRSFPLHLIQCLTLPEATIRTARRRRRYAPHGLLHAPTPSFRCRWLIKVSKFYLLSPPSL